MFLIFCAYSFSFIISCSKNRNTEVQEELYEWIFYRKHVPLQFQCSSQLEFIIDCGTSLYLPFLCFLHHSLLQIYEETEKCLNEQHQKLEIKRFLTGLFHNFARLVAGQSYFRQSSHLIIRIRFHDSKHHAHHGQLENVFLI